jgi:hypothetical protein
LPSITFISLPSCFGKTLEGAPQIPIIVDIARSVYRIPKYSHYRPMGSRGFWVVKASRLHDSTWRW